MAETRIAHDDQVRVTVGVDTHKDTHVARAKDQLGRRLGERAIPTTPAGYADLLAWAKGLGVVETFGLEGTSSYGAGLAATCAVRDRSSSRSSAPTARPAGVTASPTPRTPTPRPRPCCQVTHRGHPKPVRGRWR